MQSEEQAVIFRSRAGHLIRVRPLQREDAPFLVDIFENMTAESRYRRFHQSLDHVSSERIWAEANSIAQADPERSWGLIAFAALSDGQNIAVGAVRLVRTEPREAEVAISIRDDFQNMGIGTQLMHMLVEAASKMGIRQLVASIQNNNPAIWQVFKRLPYPVARLPDGAYSDVVISL